MLTAKQLKAIAKAGGYDEFSEKTYETASALLHLSVAESQMPNNEIWLSDDDVVTEMDIEWRRQMEKD